ncbi:CoA transferase [Achromobacter sp. GG226]|uniref:CaiB/BaiF CoA transferase family protein n=1 Tax=Verticiella alkaliphila TaxID=2779529 RepID=UPI001C0B4CB2|nr:CoA transferase [Verticiella sp. GG226]MBU4611460.1 CoA transferase [Verticiella sp. GG226]
MHIPSADSLPLDGVRILDLSAYIAGPYGCALLADMGATVTKVEPPEGDNLRKYPSTLPKESRAFLGVNRGKRGLCLDLKAPGGREVIHRLAAQADVLVHNFRPGVPERLGIDAATLHALNPRLIICAMTGYGDAGPMARHAGYDQVLQSMTGMCASQAKGDGEPEILYGSVVDYYGASLIASSIGAALYQRERTGHGQVIKLSLLGSALAMQSARLVWADDEPRHIERDMRSGGVTGIHPTAEGYLYLSANTPRFWQSLCEHTGLDDLATDTAYDSVKKRAQHADVLVARLREALARAPAAAWAERFGQSVPCSVVNRIGDMFDHPQVQAMDYVGDLQTRTVRYRGLTRWADFGGVTPDAPAGAPALGEHGDAILAEAGFSADDIQALRANAAVH